MLTMLQPLSCLSLLLRFVLGVADTLATFFPYLAASLATLTPACYLKPSIGLINSELRPMPRGRKCLRYSNKCRNESHINLMQCLAPVAFCIGSDLSEYTGFDRTYPLTTSLGFD